jgi:hypothetical protein
MPIFQSENLTSGQSVNPNIKQDNPKDVLKFVQSCVDESNQWRNRFSVRSESMSWLQDSNNYMDLYDGKLYKKRKKIPYECKEDAYREYVDFNQILLCQFDYNAELKKITDEDQSLDGGTFTRILNWCLNELSDGKAKEERMVQIGGIFGNGVYYFQPKEKDGYVWPSHEVVDTRQIIISPNAIDADDAIYMGWRRPVSTTDLKNLFPSLASVIKPDYEGADLGMAQSGTGTVVIEGLGGGYSGTIGIGNSVGAITGDNVKYQTVLTELYFRDPEVIELQSEEDVDVWVKDNPGFGSEFFQSKAKVMCMKRMNVMAPNPITGLIEPQVVPIKVKRYPFGRKILATKDVLLTDVANPYPVFPLPTFKCFERPLSFWAKGVIEVMREPMQNMQLLTAGMAANADYVNKPSYQNTNSRIAMVSKKIPLKPNSVVGTDGEIKPIPRPGIAPTDMLNAINYRQKKMESSTGLDSLLTGVNQSGNYSGIQTNALMEGALMKPGKRLKNLNRCRKSLGFLYYWWIKNWCTDGRELEFMSEDEIKTKISLNQIKTQQDPTTGEVTILTGPDGKPMIENDVTKGDFIYTVDVSTNVPATPSQKFQQVQGIAKIFAPIAPIAAGKIQLEALPMPNKQKYIRMFEEAVQSKQEADMRQSMMQMQIQQAQLEAQKVKDEREQDRKEIETGAKVQEAAAWVLQAFSKALTDAKAAGTALPPEFVQEIRAIALSTTGKNEDMNLLAQMPTPPKENTNVSGNA